MKKLQSNHILGSLFTIIAALGLIFSLASITAIWIIKPRIQSTLLGLLDSFDDTLTTTDQGLDVLDSAIENTKENLSTVETTFANLDPTFDSISESLNNSAVLIGDDLRLTIIDTQVALSSAANSAKLIDNFLSILAKIPIIGADYQPEVPLHISLEQVADSLDDIPDSLETFEQSLKITVDDLSTLNTDLSDLSENLSAFEDDLNEAQLVIKEYGTIIDSVILRISNLRSNLNLYLILIYIVLTGNFFWIGFAQIGILMFARLYLQGEQQVINISDIRRD